MNIREAHDIVRLAGFYYWNGFVDRYSPQKIDAFMQQYPRKKRIKDGHDKEYLVTLYDACYEIKKAQSKPFKHGRKKHYIKVG